METEQINTEKGEINTEAKLFERWLQDLVILTNEESRKFHDGDPHTCILLTSYALANVLLRVGFVPRLLRVEVGVIPDDRNLIATLLGMGPLNRDAAAPGMWKGHLVCAVEKEWLLDPTVDQANKPDWPPAAWVRPVVVRLTDNFWSGRKMS